MKPEHSTDLIKDLVKLPLNYFIYIKNIILKKHTIDYQNYDILYHIGYFIISIIILDYVVGFYTTLNINTIQIDLLKMVNKPYIFIFYIFNALPLGIIFSTIVYSTVASIDKKFSFLILINSFSQIIKLFSILNVVIAIIMLVGINELIINQNNIFDYNEYKKAIQNNYILYITIFANVVIILISFFKIVFNPLSRLLKKKFSLFISILISLIIILTTVAINTYLYNTLSIYPKIEAKKLINKKEFCLQTINHSIENNETLRNEMTFMKYTNMLVKCNELK
ncbi:hypothetical protein LXN10_13400 [Arcobacter sp. KX21116]|uniref:hypothetical protein n=1 Tax=Arcobacter iocasae TaxID=2906515 RepID=UPI0035D4A958